MTADQPEALTRPERLNCLRLIRSDRIGPIIYRQLLSRFGSAGAALEALPDLARRGGRQRPLRICSQADAERELAAWEALGTRLIALGEPEYPVPLAAVEDAPPLLGTLGDPALLQRPSVGVVGARNASANGRRLASELAAGLGAAGFVVTSGLARGIDAAAHRGALESGTIAAVAGGVDVVYPQENRDLQQAIAGGGLIVSEMPPGTKPQARHFPRRNRLISGLSLGVLVVEAALRSGSLITARMALEQGREVFAVPGSPLDPRARGSNDLIRQGATLVESADDVNEVLSGLLSRPLAARQPDARSPIPPENPPVSEVDSARGHLEELLGPQAVTVDELIRQCQLSPPVATMALLEMELAGRIERHPGNRVALRYQGRQESD